MSPEIISEKVENAWKKCIEDHNKFKINSEPCLQSALYYHLRKSLKSEKISILTEARINLPNINLRHCKRIDILICEQDHEDSKTVICGIELKYTPRGTPGIKGVKKDMESLSYLHPFRRREERIEVFFKRHESLPKPQIIKLSPDIKYFFGAFLQAQSPHFESKKTFWDNHQPSEGRWNKIGIPSHLSLLLALTEEANAAIPQIWD